MTNFDDAPKWYWAVADQRSNSNLLGRAGQRFVVACGQRELWERVRREVEPTGLCSWHGFGPRDGNATLADCMYVFLHARESYGANYNRVTLEMAQVPAFARFIKDAPSGLCNWVSNPSSLIPLPREAYDEEAHHELARRVGVVLNLPEDWWHD